MEYVQNSEIRDSIFSEITSYNANSKGGGIALHKTDNTSIVNSLFTNNKVDKSGVSI